ncbi:hypothetical protein HY945_03890 [Candidatus Gottesmanbacteria bacterium]|nr:hypothetical protein [Candidatus Gottesmanbacteria bacterium]
MKLQKALLFLFILPVTLFLDLILYGLVKSCPSCGSFWQWVGTEGALSFPIVIGLTQWFSRFFPKSLK